MLILFTLSTLLVLTSGLATWKSEPQSGDIPGPRSNAGMAKIGGGLYVFAGYLQCPESDFCATEFYNDVYRYDFQDNSWTKPILTSVAAPSNRTFFPYVTDTKTRSFILFGGLIFNLPSVTVFGDLWRYHAKTNSWAELAQYNEGPGQRAGSGMVLNENKLYVGFGIDETVFGPNAAHNDLWSFDLTTGLWTLLVPDNSSNPNQPFRRYRPAMQLDDKREKIIVFSGDMAIGDPVETVNDTWSYDISSGKWTFLNNNAVPLGNRQDAVSTVYKKTFYLMFGDTETDTGRCENNITGAGNNPRNELFKCDLKDNPNEYDEFFTNNNPGKLMRSAFTRDDNKLYLWSGFHFPCNVPGNGTIVYETGLFRLNLDNV